MTSTIDKQRFKADTLEFSTRSRTIVGTLLTILAFVLLGIALLPLGLVIVYVILKGGSRINWSLFTELPPAALQQGGGIANLPTV